MKNIITGAAFIFLAGSVAEAQITMQPALPASGLVQKNQLWNIVLVNNSTVSYTAKLDLVLTDRSTGQEVMTAGSGQFTVAAGTRQLNADALMPIQYNSVNGTFETRFQGLLPAGNYTACYSLTGQGNKEVLLSEECISFDVEPLSPPMLVFPADSTSLEPTASQFSWIPPMPAGMFTNLHYEVIITPVNEGQHANEAIQENIPFYSQDYQQNSSLVYPGSAPAFEKEKWYAWQVVAKDDKNYAGKSEVWVFKVAPASWIKAIIEQTPFIRMKRDNPEKGIAPNGYLKLSYRNETIDTAITIHIRDLSKGDKNEVLVAVPVKPGENLIQKDLRKVINVKEGTVYEAYIENSRLEKWRLLFEVHQYEEKKENN